MIRVVVVDDEPLARTGVQYALAPAGDVEVTSAVPVKDAVGAIRQDGPGVVLLDSCPSDAPMLAEGLSGMHTPPRVCVLSRSSDEQHIATALAAGAHGYVLKNTPTEQLAPLVRFLAAGWTMTSPAITRAMKEHFLAGHIRQDATDRLAKLTRREYEVLVLLAQGLSNQEIAALAHLSPATVKDHVSAILRKLHVQRRIHAAVLADRAGLLPG
ncbi:LuxR C-terminal-related transcriptional regulator [Kitasatospora sp. cg17-2]